MQSTGHTSTHALSLTLMQGSAMTYGIRTSLDFEHFPCRESGQNHRFVAYFSQRVNRSPGVFTGSSVSSAGIPAVDSGTPHRASLCAQAWVERISQGVPEQVEGEDGEADCQSRKDRDPRRRLRELDGRSTKHEAPRRDGLLHSEPKE